MKVIAYYLPQYHEIPENNEWWGKGFTEWVNVKKAQPIFKGHYQPRLPGELGYYDLSKSDTQLKQTELAKKAGIDAFCYWHYWFGNGKLLLEKPFEHLLADKKNNIGFCLGWANESWKSKQWKYSGKGDKILIEQLYPGKNDYIAHFNYVLSAFKDSRYLTCNGKPVFLIYRPNLVPDIKLFIDLWNKLAIQNGFPGICFIADIHNDYKLIPILRAAGIDYITTCHTNFSEYPILKQVFFALKNIITDRPIRTIDYKYIVNCTYTKKDLHNNIIPSVIPNWDHSPRSRNKCTIMHNSTPELFKKQVCHTLSYFKQTGDPEFLFVKSWNEWGEGNYLEPDKKWGLQYIEKLNEALTLCKRQNFSNLIRNE